MTTSKYYNSRVIRIGLTFGLIGGGLMIYLDFADFGLYYLHSYLYILNYLLTMLVGLRVYKKFAKDNSTYLKRLIAGLLIYAIMTICYFIYSVIFEKFGNDRAFEDKVFVPLIIVAFGLILSSFLALFFKPRNILK